ncbi:MAG TPA: hypothetical protein VFX20_03815 [Steroidobacteraceae bacterium]|nr:hypothetical protein [Steroidobacteraceae bacterium]
MSNRFLRGLIPALVLAALPAISPAGVFVGVSVNIAPPPLPVYDQPPCPEAGYIWTPGYWAWNEGAYYWVPGTWVLPPQVGLLWTPGYWGWEGGAYYWHAGYWGPHVGFYGGVPYGFGYDGAGFVGGYWRGRVFFYNRAVVHVGPTFVRNVYSRPVVHHTTYEHVSFHGGPGGVRARPSHAQVAAEHDRHVAFTSLQQRQQRMAFADRSLRADYNHGKPSIAATARPAMFHGTGTFGARAAGGPVHATPAHGAARHTAAPSHTGAPPRSDRPAWAAGQNHTGRPVERGAAMHPQPQPHVESRPRPQPHSHPQVESRPQPQSHPEPRPQPQSRPHFESRPQAHPVQRPPAPPEPQARQGSAPHQRAPASQMHSPAPRGPAAHPQPPHERGGGERPHKPPESRNR